MEFTKAKRKFISTWGSLGSSWGINKAMAQIHALLFISTKPLSMEEIMEELQISRGNTSMNLRQLIDWGIVTKENVIGERKEYFGTEKDVQELARIIAKERSRRELQPVLKTLQELSSIQPNNSSEFKEFVKQIKAMYELTSIADTLLNQIANHKRNWLSKSILKIFK